LLQKFSSSLFPLSLVLVLVLVFELNSLVQMANCCHEVRKRRHIFLFWAHSKRPIFFSLHFSANFWDTKNTDRNII